MHCNFQSLHKHPHGLHGTQEVKSSDDSSRSSPDDLQQPDDPVSDSPRTAKKAWGGASKKPTSHVQVHCKSLNAVGTDGLSTFPAPQASLIDQHSLYIGNIDLTTVAHGHLAPLCDVSLITFKHSSFLILDFVGSRIEVSIQRESSTSLLETC